MPTLKVKTIYVDKLKALGIYDHWIVNVKRWCDKYPENAVSYQSNLYNVESFQRFIASSFSWSETIQGVVYWQDISGK